MQSHSRNLAERPIIAPNRLATINDAEQRIWLNLVNHHLTMFHNYLDDSSNIASSNQTVQMTNGNNNSTELNNFERFAINLCNGVLNWPEAIVQSDVEKMIRTLTTLSKHLKRFTQNPIQLDNQGLLQFILESGIFTQLSLIALDELSAQACTANPFLAENRRIYALKCMAVKCLIRLFGAARRHKCTLMRNNAQVLSHMIDFFGNMRFPWSFREQRFKDKMAKLLVKMYHSDSSHIYVRLANENTFNYVTAMIFIYSNFHRHEPKLFVCYYALASVIVVNVPELCEKFYKDTFTIVSLSIYQIGPNAPFQRYDLRALTHIVHNIGFLMARDSHEPQMIVRELLRSGLVSKLCQVLYEEEGSMYGIIELKQVIVTLLYIIIYRMSVFEPSLLLNLFRIVEPLGPIFKRYMGQTAFRHFCNAIKRAI